MRHGETVRSAVVETTLLVKWFAAAVLVASALNALAALEARAQMGAQTGAQTGEPIASRNTDVSRGAATPLPRNEHDQAIIDGWPLYRTARGQQAFNDTMATLKATEGPAPAAQAFAGCANLECAIDLPKIDANGWLPAGRVWLSPKTYVLISHSPRDGTSRRPHRSMRVYVFHEFHNSSRNVDTFDTISSHSGSVFVPLYMSKSMMDAVGRAFVMVVQIAPYDVISTHATNMDSAGPGIEVARNSGDAVEPLQNLAGIVTAVMIKAAAPHLDVVNHRGSEGQPMLEAYEEYASNARGRKAVTLPFTPASEQRIASATGSIDDLITRRGQSPRLAVADRGIAPRRSPGMDVAAVPTPTPAERPSISYGSDADRATALAPSPVTPTRAVQRPTLR